MLLIIRKPEQHINHYMGNELRPIGGVRLEKFGKDEVVVCSHS